MKIQGRVTEIIDDPDENYGTVKVVITIRKRGLPSTIEHGDYGHVRDKDGEIVSFESYMETAKATYKKRYNYEPDNYFIDGATRNYNELVKRIEQRQRYMKMNEAVENFKLGFVSIEHITREAYNE